MRLPLTLALLCLTTPVAAAVAAPAQAPQPGWPCEGQPPAALALSRYWPGADGAQARGWRSDATVAALVRDIAPRSLSEADGIARIADLGARATDRRRTMAALVAGLVEEIDRERQAIIAGIRRFNKRQAQLARRIEQSYDMMDRQGAEADGASPTGQQQAGQEALEWDTQIFEDRQRMLPVICRQPAMLENRLKSFAEAARKVADGAAPAS